MPQHHALLQEEKTNFPLAKLDRRGNNRGGGTVKIGKTVINEISGRLIHLAAAPCLPIDDVTFSNLTINRPPFEPDERLKGLTL
jgi:hypothetical protein